MQLLQVGHLNSVVGGIFLHCWLQSILNEKNLLKGTISQHICSGNANPYRESGYMLKKSYQEEKGKHTKELQQLVTLPLASSASEAFFGRLQSRDKVDPQWWEWLNQHVNNEFVWGSAGLSEIEPVGTLRGWGKNGNGGKVIVVRREPWVALVAR